MLYCVRMDVNVPFGFDNEELEELKAKEKARGSTAAHRQVAPSLARGRALRQEVGYVCRRGEQLARIAWLGPGHVRAHATRQARIPPRVPRRTAARVDYTVGMCAGSTGPARTVLRGGGGPIVRSR